MNRGDEKATGKLHLRATPSQVDAVQRRAQGERRSVSEWLRLRLEQWLEEAPPPPSGPPPPRGHRGSTPER